MQDAKESELIGLVKQKPMFPRRVSWFSSFLQCDNHVTVQCFYCRSNGCNPVRERS